jgi:manganese-dependent ADP-ribose/CDP-alcohol diphosphatase
VEQLEWFGKQLEDSHRDGKKVIVCGHVPVHHQSSEHMCLAWDYKEVLQKMWSYEGTVLAYFAGHYHAGGYFRDKYNIHHITFHAVLETAPNSNSYATVKVFDDRVSVEGVGMVGYYDIFFNSE